MLDFPNSPIVGATYTGPNGVIWVWDGSKWVNGTTIGTAYAPIQSPVFTGNPTAPTPPLADNDTSVATTQFVQSTVAPAFNGVGRNYIHNPLFNVAQRGAGPFTTSGSYTLDRWAISYGGGTNSITSAPLSDADRAAIGDESATATYWDVFTGSAGVNDYVFVGYQPLERVRRLAGKTVVVSFWARAAAGAPKLGVNFYQFFGTGGSPSAGVYATAQAFTLSTTWTRYISAPFVLPSSSGKTLGTNGDDYTQFTFWGSAGANNNTVAGGIGVQSSTVGIWGVQLEVGSVATPLEKPDPRYDLANCERFFSTGAVTVYAAYPSAGGGFGQSITLPVTMRAYPTITLGTPFSNTNASAPSTSLLSSGMFLIYVTTLAGGQMNYSNTFTASADL